VKAAGSGAVKQRIAMWSVVGFLVSGCWVIVALINPIALAEPAARNLAVFIQPIAMVSFYFHVPMHFLEVMLANAGMYGLVGLMIEMLRRSLHHAR
jgi:hypothetical protein